MLMRNRTSVMDAASHLDQELSVIKNLELARQCTIDNLERIEDENKYHASAPRVPAPWRPSARPANKIRKAKPSKTEGERTDNNTRDERASTWIKSLVIEEQNNTLISLEFQHWYSAVSSNTNTPSLQDMSIMELETSQSRHRYAEPTNNGFPDSAYAVAVLDLARGEASIPNTKSDPTEPDHSVITREMERCSIERVIHDCELCSELDGKECGILLNKKVTYHSCNTTAKFNGRKRPLFKLRKKNINE